MLADQSPDGRDLTHLQPGETMVREMRLLITRRNDVVADRIRTISQLRRQLTTVCPALDSPSSPTSTTCYVLFQQVELTERRIEFVPTLGDIHVGVDGPVVRTSAQNGL